MINLPRLPLIFAVSFAAWSSTSTLMSQGISGPYLAARQASVLSDYDQAARYYERAIARDSRNLLLMENAMTALIGKGDMDRAVEIANEHQRAGGRNQVATLLMNAKAMKGGDFAPSLEDRGEVDGLAPLIDGIIRGWALLGSGQASDAAAAFAEVAENPDFASLARYHEALSHAMVGDFETADGIFSGDTYGPLSLSARGIEAHAQVLAQLERRDDAIELLNASLQNRFSADLDALRAKLMDAQTPDYDFVTSAAEGVAEVYFNIAAILRGRAAPDYIMIYARMAEYLRPDHAPAILTIAELLEDLDQYDLATLAFAKINTDHPSYFLAEMGRADALFADGREDAAVEVLTALSKSSANTPLVHAALGDMLGRLRRDQEAFAAYSTSLDLRADDDVSAWRVYYARGIIQERMDDFTGMEADFRKALDLFPDQPDVLNYLGYSLVEQRLKLDEALAMIEKAVEQRPENGYITDSLAWVFYRLGRYEEAIAPMERAVELVPVDPIINDHLGDIYWKVGRTREAEFQWKRALSFDPEEDEAIRIRRKLETGLDIVLEEEAANSNGTDD